MKRGWIHWNRAELPPAAFEARLEGIRKRLAERALPALVVYSDVWRSNHARYFVNFMPYWNRALVVLPRDGSPVLLCGLSPRVYPWIRSVSVLEEIRPSNNLARQLLDLASQNQWKRIGILDLPQLPHDISAPICAGAAEFVDVPSSGTYEPGSDEWELAMRRRAVQMARRILQEEMTGATGSLDYQFVGRLERAFRRAGAEDLVILLSNGRTSPAPARGAVIKEGFSVILAMEYRGHWVKLSRPWTSAQVSASLQTRWEGLRQDFQRPLELPVFAENLSGPCPYEFCDRFHLRRGDLFAFHVEFRAGGQRLFYGDTCRFAETGADPL